MAQVVQQGETALREGGAVTRVGELAAHQTQYFSLGTPPQQPPTPTDLAVLGVQNASQTSASAAATANATVTTGAAESSGSATAAKAAPKAPSNQPTTKGDVGKGTEKGVRTFLEGAYFAMPMVAPSFVESGEKIYWLLDSGSSYHVVSQATLESGHVKVLSRKKRPKTVCQTATGDLVEVGSDTHATIEVNFLTTRHFEQRGGVLSTFACTCRLEAEVTLLPAVFGDCTWLQSVMADSVGQLVGQSSCDSSGVQLASAKKGWTGRAEAMEISSDEEALSHNNRNYCEYCMVCGKHATEAHLMSDSHNHHMKSWIARNRPGLRLLPDRLSDPERIDMMIQLRMPDLAEPEIKKARELVLRLAWFSNQPAKAGASTLPPEDNSEATAKSSNALPGIWAEPSEPPRAVERRVLPTEPETRRVKARPWPDTLGVQQRSTQQLEGARALTPLSEGVAAQAVFTSPVKTPPGWTPPNSPTDSENWGGWKPAQAGRGDLQPKTPPKSVDPKGLGSMMPKTPPKTAPLEAPVEEDTEMAEDTGMEQEAPSPPNVSPSVPPPDEARDLYGGRSRLLEDCSGDGHRVSTSASAHCIADPTSCSYREPAYFKPNGERSGATTGTTAGTSIGNVGYQPAATSAKEIFSQPDPVIVSQLSKPDAMNNGLFALPTHQHAWKHSRVHASCEFCGQPCSVFISAAVVAPLQEEDPLNQKNHNKEPNTQPEGPAGLGLAAGQGELIISQDPETRRELHKCFIILVHVLAFAIGVTFRPEGMSGRESAGDTVKVLLRSATLPLLNEQCVLFRYAAHVHNRFAVSVGNTMSPLQKLRGHDHKPQLTYPFGAVVFAKVSRSSKEEVDTKYARGVYLGPVLGSTGHQVRIRLDSGETKLIVAPGLKLLYPLRYDASLLDGARPLEGFVPPLDEERFRELHLPYVPGGGPSKEWIREHGGTPKCPGCSEEATSSRHSIKCVRRYQRWLRDAVDNALEELGRDPPPAQGPPAKRVRFGDSEVREFPAPSAPSEQEVEVPQISAEANDHLSDYEPSLPSEDEGKDDLMGVAEAPKDDRPAIRLLEEMWACGCVRYVPTPLTACDVYDLQAFCSLLVDGRSSCDKLPYSCIALLEHERVEHDVGRPRSSYDDVDGIQLDNKESWEGMKTEVKAVDSLQVGLLRSRSEVGRYQEENPGCRPTLFSGWVQLGKKWTYIIALAYVDDLLIVSDSQEGVEFIHKSLSAVLKVKVTGRLHEDGQLEFLGRLIKLDGNNITLGVKPEYVRSVFSAFGWTEKDLAKVKPVATTPDIRALYDAEDPESPSPSLSPEAAGRFRSCLGKIGWLTQTRTDITYFHSMLSRGQAAPRMVHEDALRKFLRWLVGCPLLDQVFPAGSGETLEEEGATLIAKPLAIYTDSASARQIAGMEGFLRRMRHVDIRLCFIQDRVHQNELVINGVAGEENVSDLLTKNLNRPQTLKHTTTLGLEDVHQVDLCAVPVVRSCVFLTGLLNSIFDNTELEWERFLGLCELPTSYGTLFIEFCTDPQSSFVTTGCDYSVFVLPVTVEVDGTSPETELGNEGCSLEQHALYRG
ncbi:RE1 [Symbiodinium sp. CCMP2592]|nr:RE1 [Symbiodinium sp. CCMP2592]